MIRWILVVAGLSGLLAVAMGAFGAHALAGFLEGRAGEIYATANLYHFVHTLALIGVALAPPGGASRRLCVITAVFWLMGIALFSGSLYTLALTGIAALGMVAPLGGLAFMAGWFSLAWAAWQARS